MFQYAVPCIFYYIVLWPTNAQLVHKLSHSYMFRHYRVILRELAKLHKCFNCNCLANVTVTSIICMQTVWSLTFKWPLTMHWWLIMTTDNHTHTHTQTQYTFPTYQYGVTAHNIRAPTHTVHIPYISAQCHRTQHKSTRFISLSTIHFKSFT